MVWLMVSSACMVKTVKRGQYLLYISTFYCILVVEISLDVDLVCIRIAQNLDLAYDCQPNRYEIFQVEYLSDLEFLKLALKAVVTLFYSDAPEGPAKHLILVDGRL